MKNVKNLLVILIFTFTLLLIPSQAHAVALILTADQQQLYNDDEYTADVSLSIRTTNGTQYYLRGVFFKPNTSQYCGYTWNEEGEQWFNGSDLSNEGWKHFYPVTITDNAWNGKIKFAFDPESDSCKEGGTYNFKIQRFTATGTKYFDDQNVLTVTVTLPTPLPTDEPTATPKPTTKQPTPTRVPTPTKVPTPIKVPTPKKTPTADPQKSQSTSKSLSKDKLNLSGIPTSVLGASTAAVKKSVPNSPTPKNKKVIVDSVQQNKLPIIALIGGGVFIIACGILSFLHIRKKSE